MIGIVETAKEAIVTALVLGKPRRQTLRRTYTATLPFFLLRLRPLAAFTSGVGATFPAWSEEFSDF
jgi:hypothetical protein